MNNETLYNIRREMLESRLDTLCREREVPQKRLLEAMRYSLLAGGKRIRPILTMEFCAACGAAAELALDLGCAVEMLHTYSLIHDDLPCMDNDDLRRGKPTSHKMYGEWMALLAGDALQAEAFYTIADCGLHSAQIMEALKILAHAAGHRGICGGQLLDLDGVGKELTASEVFTTHAMKTAALIEAACELGCVAADAGIYQREAAKRYGQAVGLAFQIRDDILDYEGSAEALGKSVGKDEKSGKFTFVNLFGLERCHELVRENTDEAVTVAAETFENPDFLIWLANKLAGRNN
ncbi:MAG: polyprenyl synthetase family protein [Clostridiales bacterium]|nr:polyprenyl synthetase family protein [Clostridiales bacterium]